jgi:hypothetical protein
LWVLFTCRAVISLSHFLEILALGLGSLSSLGTGSPRIVGPWWQKYPSWESHLYSFLRDRYLRDTHHILSSVQDSSWRLDHPIFLQTPHWDVSWSTLGPFTQNLILSPKRSFFSVIRPGPNIH